MNFFKNQRKEKYIVINLSKIVKIGGHFHWVPSCLVRGVPKPEKLGGAGKNF
jgi:hypothetical protein